MMYNPPMSRFYRHSRITPRLLYNRRVARAWLSAAALLPIGGCLIAALLRQTETHWSQQEGTVALIGIPYTADAVSHAAPESIPHRPARPITPPAVPLPATPTLLCFDFSSHPEAELADDYRLLNPEADDSGEDAAEALLTLAAPAAPSQRPAASAVEKHQAAAPKALAATRTAKPAPQPQLAAQGALPNTPPAYLSAPRPPYPAAMRGRRLSGSVGVRIHISAEGTPTDVDIIGPSGHSDFDSTTRSWILQHWRFRPAISQGKAIAATVRTRVDFVMD